MAEFTDDDLRAASLLGAEDTAALEQMQPEWGRFDLSDLATTPVPYDGDLLLPASEAPAPLLDAFLADSPGGLGDPLTLSPDAMTSLPEVQQQQEGPPPETPPAPAPSNDAPAAADISGAAATAPQHTTLRQVLRADLSKILFPQPRGKPESFSPCRPAFVSDGADIYTAVAALVPECRRSKRSWYNRVVVGCVQSPGHADALLYSSITSWRSQERIGDIAWLNSGALVVAEHKGLAVYTMRVPREFSSTASGPAPARAALLSAHAADVRELALHRAAAGTLASCSDDGVVQVADVGQGRVVTCHRLGEGSGAATSVRWVSAERADAHSFLSGAGELYVVDRRAGPGATCVVHAESPDRRESTSHAWLDETHVVVAHQTGLLSFFDVRAAARGPYDRAQDMTQAAVGDVRKHPTRALLATFGVPTFSCWGVEGGTRLGSLTLELSRLSVQDDSGKTATSTTVGAPVSARLEAPNLASQLPPLSLDPL
eukprot:m51a1_g1087 hypothetical protein (487) ;mRNA; r:48574-51218